MRCLPLLPPRAAAIGCAGRPQHAKGRQAYGQAGRRTLPKTYMGELAREFARGATLACRRAAGEVLCWARPRPACVFVPRRAAISKTVPAKAQARGRSDEAGELSETQSPGENARWAREPHTSPRVARTPPVQRRPLGFRVEHFCTLGCSFALPARFCGPGRKRHALAMIRQDGCSNSVVLWCNG
jgi:hypothetical protein